MKIKKEILEEIRNVVLYLVLSENKHYEECQPSEQRKHIYKAVMKVSRWLDKQNGIK